MAGEVLSSQLNATPPPGGPSIEAKPKGPLEGEGEVTIELSGQLKILDYPVSAKGRVSALRCPK
jgi:hypothetical protein